MSSRIYVYGIIDSAEEFKLRRGERLIYSIAYRDIAAVVRNCNSLEDFGGAVKDYALFHENVAETLMNDFTVLPMRMFTVFNSVEQISVMLSRYYRAFKENFTRLAQKVEFGLKVLWPVENIKARIGLIREQNETHSGISPAKNFMLKKLETYKHEKAFMTEAENLILKIDAFFSGLAVEKKLRKLQTEKLLLNASYLVPKGSRITNAFNELKNTITELEYQFSGPWPPYNFIVLPPAGTGIDSSDILDQVLNINGR